MMKTKYLQTKFQRLLAVLGEKGLMHVTVFLFNHFFAWPITKYYQNLKQKRVNFCGVEITYLFHSYNHTWLNPRMIEVPIIWYIVQHGENENKRILEVGNVLSHYFPVKHDVIDKYEDAEGITKQDIICFTPSHRYDLIISISTLEHVGYDEIPKRPEKIFCAIDHMKSLLREKGEMYITLPIGENPYLDGYLQEGRIRFDKQYNFIRTSRTEWRETTYEDIAFAQLNKPFRFGNALIIGYFQNHG